MTDFLNVAGSALPLLNSLC